MSKKLTLKQHKIEVLTKANEDLNLKIEARNSMCFLERLWFLFSNEQLLHIRPGVNSKTTNVQFKRKG